MRHGEQMTIIRPPGRDTMGDPLPGTGVERIVVGAFAPGSTSEDVLTRGDTTYTLATAYLPYDTDIVATDQVRARGRVWQVDGDPLAWRSPGTGRQAGLQVGLRSVRG